MEDFNYENRKYLKLDKLDNDKVEKIYKDYEEINYSIDKNKLLMNGFKVAKIKNIDSKEKIKNLKGILDFDNDNVLTMSYTN